MSTNKTENITVITSDGITVIPVHEPVCDWCDDDLSNASEGGVFHHKATCGKCWPRLKANAEAYGEDDLLIECPSDIGLANWIKKEFWR